MRESHYDYNEGLYDSILRDVLGRGFENPFRTAKTLCGKRVPVQQINNTCPTCASCVTQHQTNETQRHEDTIVVQEILSSKG